MRRQLVHIILHVWNAGTLMAQGLEEARDRFQSVVSRLLLTNDFVHGRLHGVLHFLSFSGHIPTQLLKPDRVLIIIPQIFLHICNNGIKCPFNLGSDIGVTS